MGETLSKPREKTAERPSGIRGFEAVESMESSEYRYEVVSKVGFVFLVFLCPPRLLMIP